MKPLLIIFLFSVLLCSCGNNDNVTNQQNSPVDTSTFILPLEIGNYWNYQSISTVSDIRPDSILHFFTEYPIYGSGTLNSVKDTILNGTSTRLLINNYTEDTTTYQSKMYYLQTDSTLQLFAYWLHSSSDIFPDYKNRIYFTFNGKIYRSLRELFLTYEICEDLSILDSIIYENPPPSTLKYPIVTNKEWIYKLFNQSILSKNYVNFENLTIGAQQISCIKTQFKWSTIDGLDVYDYYSKYGKLRHYLYANDVIVTDELGHELGKIDLKDISTVTSFHIQN